MSIYKELYLSLFNDVSNAIDILESAQKKAEAIYIEYGTKKPVITKFEPKKNDDKE